MTNPSLDYFLPYQQAWINDPSPFVIGEKSRRIGWTYAASYRAVERRVRKLGNLYFSSADFTAGREFMDYCRTWCKVFNVVAKETSEDVVIDDRKFTNMVLTFASGVKIVAGSSNPVFFRSKGGDADADEYAFHREGRNLLKAMHATALFWGHQLRLWSTHNGEGSFFNSLLKDAREGRLKATVHRVTILDAVEQGLVEKIRKLKKPDAKARQKWLDELRATCPDQDTWNEEYMCIPGSGASSLLSYELITACERSAADLPIVEDPRDLKFNGPLYVGGDIGRKNDLTVFWGLGKVGDVFETRLRKEFRNATYQVQEEYFNLLMGLRNVRRACLDETGIGNMLAERAVQRWGSYRVEPVTFTAQVKSDLAMPLKRLFEDRLVRVPADAAVREDLHKVQRIVTTAGNVRFDAKADDAGHADRFWALALAYHAADDLKVPLPPPMRFKPVGM